MQLADQAPGVRSTTCVSNRHISALHLADSWLVAQLPSTQPSSMTPTLTPSDYHPQHTDFPMLLALRKRNQLGDCDATGRQRARTWHPRCARHRQLARHRHRPRGQRDRLARTRPPANPKLSNGLAADLAFGVTVMPVGEQALVGPTRLRTRRWRCAIRRMRSRGAGSRRNQEVPHGGGAMHRRCRRSPSTCELRTNTLAVGGRIDHPPAGDLSQRVGVTSARPRGGQTLRPRTGGSYCQSFCVPTASPQLGECLANAYCSMPHRTGMAQCPRPRAGVLRMLSEPRISWASVVSARRC